jgi:hypothetical protein
MIEILYCPVNNELLLFTGRFEVDLLNDTITIYLQNNRKCVKKVTGDRLVHIGWL